MEQGKPHSEEKSSTVEEIKEPVDDCNKIKSFAHEELSSDGSKFKEDDLKRSREYNAIKYTYSRHPSAKRKFDDNETTPSSSCYQMVPKIGCSLEMNGHLLPTQEASNNPVQLLTGEDIQAPARKERQADRFKSEDEFAVVSTTNAFTNGSQNTNEPSEPSLIEFQIDQSAEKCLQVLIDKVVYDHEIEVGILLSLQAFQQSNEQKHSKNPKNTAKSQLPTRKTRIGVQSNLENLNGSSSQKIVEVQIGKKPAISSINKNPLLKFHRPKKVQKEFRILLSVLEEVERMNDYYKKDIIETNRTAREIQSLALHVNENLEVLENVTPCYITINNEGEPCHKMNVFDHGSKILKHVTDLQLKTWKFLNEYNCFRLKFHEISIYFVSTPLDQIIGSRQKGALDEALEMARCIYKDFFCNEEFDLQFEKLNAGYKALEIHVEQFNKYIDILANNFYS